MTPEQLALARLVAPMVRADPPEGIVLVRDVADPGPSDTWRLVWGANDHDEQLWMSADDDQFVHPPDDVYTARADALMCITHDGIPDMTDPVTAAWVESRPSLWSGR